MSYHFKGLPPPIAKGISEDGIKNLYKKSDYSESIKIFICKNAIETKGELTTNNKVFNITIDSSKLIDLGSDYISLPSLKTIDLGGLFRGLDGNKIVCSKQDKTENRIVLYFDHPSNLNACGMCGTSDGEKGYRILYFDKKWNLKNNEEYLIESCLQNIYNNKISSNKNTIKYKINNSENNTSSFIAINKLKATIQK